MNYQFEIPLRAIPKGRPRFKGHAYTPHRTKQYENEIADYLESQFNQSPLKGDIKLAITFIFKNESTADIDNLAKSILDAAEGILFVNDRQIVTLNLKKEKADYNYILLYMEGEV